MEEDASGVCFRWIAEVFLEGHILQAPQGFELVPGFSLLPLMVVEKPKMDALLKLLSSFLPCDDEVEKTRE